MDNQKFGKFISELRKEKGWTQNELAEKLNVTDKAISKWERGLGYPDIKLIEPLADALGVSIMEIMRSKKNEAPEVSNEHAEEAITNMIDVAVYHRSIERRNIIIAAVCITAAVMTAFLIDTMGVFPFFMVVFPILMLVIGIFLIGITIHRKKQGLTYTLTLVLGILALLVPVLHQVFLIVGFLMGGMVPN